MSNILTVYYSRKGENYCSGSIRNLEKGNTEIVAAYVHKAVGGELFELTTVQEYAKDYHACTEEAKKELREGARPALKTCPASMDAYDTLFVGFPNWWGTMPMPVLTFLERFDWHGKRVIPFCTNEGSGMGSSERDLAKACVGATLVKGLAVHGSEAAQSESKAAAWARAACGI